MAIRPIFIVGSFLTSATGDSDQVMIKGDFSLSLVFSSTGSVTLQRQLPGQSTWQTVSTYTVSTEDSGINNDHDGTGGLYRLHVTANAGDINYWLGA